MKDIYNEKKTIDELYRAIEAFMEFDVEGDEYDVEQDFEDAIRTMLEEEGFNVLPKQDVENTQNSVEGLFSENVDRQIPDISVHCDEGLAMLEMKYCREPKDYEEDIRKVKNYIVQGKCRYGGVLFLDETPRANWNTCGIDENYYYLWEIYERK